MPGKTRTKVTRNAYEELLYKQLKSSKLTYSYEPGKIHYVQAHSYTPDFLVITPTGKLYIEAKGYFRREHKTKLAAVKRQHPELDIRIVFYAYNKQNIRWCEKHGYKYAVGTIPEDWLKGL